MLFLAAPALAQQQQQQQQTPSQIALQVQQVIANWAQALEGQQKQIEALTKERDELKAKLGAQGK